MTTTTTQRSASPLLGWLVCMLAATGLVGVAIWVNLGCGVTWATAAWSITEISLTTAALVLIVWAMRWHRPRWLFALVPLALLTAAALAFVVHLVWGSTFGCDVML